MPSAANLNLYGGSRSHVSWHCDDEPLFGGIGDPKLIVSLSLGSSVTFKWKAKSCSDSEASSCRLHHGDLLVMDGRCQDEYLHCTGSGLADKRVNITYRWSGGTTPSVALWLLECWDPCLPVRRVHPFWDLILGNFLFRNLSTWGCWWFWFADCLSCLQAWLSAKQAAEDLSPFSGSSALWVRIADFGEVWLRLQGSWGFKGWPGRVKYPADLARVWSLVALYASQMEIAQSLWL